VAKSVDQTHCGALHSKLGGLPEPLKGVRRTTAAFLTPVKADRTFHTTGRHTPGQDAGYKGYKSFCAPTTSGLLPSDINIQQFGLFVALPADKFQCL
jgi:hypothetical protein